MMYENEMLAFLNIPKVPKKEWDNKTPFKKGVGVVDTKGGEAFVVVGYDEEGENHTKIIKVFGIEPILAIKKIFPVPEYMDTSGIDNWDVDEESKEAAKAIANEVADMEKETREEQEQLSEWYFDEIHNIQEARAWVAAYHKRNRIRGKAPKNEESLKNYLYVLYKNQKRGLI